VTLRKVSGSAESISLGIAGLQRIPFSYCFGFEGPSSFSPPEVFVDCN